MQNRPKPSLWHMWVQENVSPDINSSDTPDPIPLFDGDSLDRNPRLSESIERGEGGLYLLYLIDDSDVIPVYIGETKGLRNRIYAHAKKIRSASEDDSAGWSKYDHIAEVLRLADGDLYVWAEVVPDTLEGPYGYDSHRQELEAKLVGVTQSVEGFKRSQANREYVPNRVMYERNDEGLDWVGIDGVPSVEPEEPTPEGTKTELWKGWLDRYLSGDIEIDDKPDPIPLFDTQEDGTVRVNDDGILRRSDAIDAKIRSEGKRCVSPEAPRDNGYEGLLYVMYQFDEDGAIIPRYVGKAEAWGKKNALSDNFAEIAKGREGTRKFARWGDGDYWHVGNLTNILKGEDNKYAHWARALFEPGTRRLKRETYLWVRAWNEEDVGPYHQQAYLAEVEPQLIELAYHVHPDSLLNKDGVPEDAPVKSRDEDFIPPQNYPRTSSEQGSLSEYE